MKNRIDNIFKDKKAFIGFLTAGDPDLEHTEEFILAMERAGADLVEIGIPFSDPIAEGIVIQGANLRALKSGTTVDKIFKMVQNLRLKTHMPLVFLTYLNPVFNFGYDNFFKMCADCGIDGIIIPDLPFEEQNEIKEYTTKYGVKLISLVAPTSNQRITAIAKESEGFLYVVSSMGVTGIRSEITTDLASMIKIAKEASNTPCAVGFGINTPAQVKQIEKIADGTIVGSAIVKIIEKYGKMAAPHIEEYVKSMHS